MTRKRGSNAVIVRNAESPKEKPPPRTRSAGLASLDAAGYVLGVRRGGSRDVLPFDAADGQRPVRVGGTERPQLGIAVHGSSRRMA